MVKTKKPRLTGLFCFRVELVAELSNQMFEEVMDFIRL